MQRTEKIRQLKEEGDYDITDALTLRKDSIGKLILRLSIGGLMLFHGLHKLIFGKEMVDQILTAVGLPVYFGFGVFLGEVVAPVMLILGFKVRLAAFLLAFNMLMATLLVHSGDFMKMTDFGGWKIEVNAFYFFGALALMFFGSGHYAITKGRGSLD
jgi:putative oxidoreductase